VSRAALASLLAVAAGLAGCDVGMDRQAKYKPQVPAPLFGDDTSAQTAPDSTLSQNAPALAAAEAQPPPVTLALLERGRERHAIFCTPCHGVDGQGQGMIVLRGFPRPAPYSDPHLLNASAGHLYDVIKNGYGIMYPYAERIPTQDRWAIVAYVRALQLAYAGDGPTGPAVAAKNALGAARAGAAEPAVTFGATR